MSEHTLKQIHRPGVEDEGGHHDGEDQGRRKHAERGRTHSENFKPRIQGEQNADIHKI